MKDTIYKGPYKHGILNIFGVSATLKEHHLTILSDLFPGIAGVHKAGVVYLIADVLVLVEGECAAQSDVENNSCRPHVYITIPITVGYHFRGWGN